MNSSSGRHRLSKRTVQGAGPGPWNFSKITYGEAGSLPLSAHLGPKMPLARVNCRWWPDQASIWSALPISLCAPTPHPGHPLQPWVSPWTFTLDLHPGSHTTSSPQLPITPKLKVTKDEERCGWLNTWDSNCSGHRDRGPAWGHLQPPPLPAGQQFWLCGPSQC